MPPIDFKPSDRLTVGLAAAVGLAVTYMAQVAGLLGQIGVTGLPEKLAVVLIIAIAIIFQRLISRRRQLLKLVDPRPRPLCELQLDALGAPMSSLAEPWAIDGYAPYVSRDGDEKLIEQLQAKPFVMLLGESGSGKTRTALEQARKLFDPLTILASLKPTPDAADASARNPLTELLDLTLRLPWRLRPYLLWIDDLGHFMEHELVEASHLRRWLDVNPGRKIVATLKSGDQERLLGAAEPLGKRARGVMDMVNPHHRMPVKWSDDEQRRTFEQYRDIGHDAAERLAHHFSFGARIVRRFDNAIEHSPEGAAVIQPAIDWYRAGLTRPIPEALLRELLEYYLIQMPLGADLDSLFQKGLEWAAAPIEGGDVALLRRIPGDKVLFTVPPILIEHAATASPAPPKPFWEHLRQMPTSSAELLAIAEAARAMGESEIAWVGADRILQGEVAEPDIQSRAIAIWKEAQDKDETAPSGSDPLGIVERVGHMPPTAYSPEGIRRNAATHIAADGPGGMLAVLNHSPAVKASIRVFSLMVFDILGLWLATICAYLILDGISLHMAQRATDARIPFVALLIVVLFTSNGLYRRHRLRADFARLLAVLAQAGILLVVLRLIVGGKVGALSLIVVGIILAAFFVGPARELHLFAARRLERLALGHKPRIALIGEAADVTRVAAILAATDLQRANDVRDVAGWISLGRDNGGNDEVPRHLPHLDTLKGLSNSRGVSILRLSNLIRNHDLSELVLCDPGLDEDSATTLADTAWLCGAKLRAVPRSRNFLAAHNRYVPGEQLPLDELRVPIFDGTQWMMKRSFDITASAMFIIITMPVLLVCAIAIRVSSKGRVLQRFPQPGRDGKKFDQLKLRTTYQSWESGEIGSVSPVGKWLRRYGLDELPQLLNVLRGEMSLVGPRPIGARALLHMQGWQTRRYLVSPGITGLWQISGRRDHDIAEIVRLDLYYVQRWSLFGDIEILLKSIPTILRGRSAMLVMPEEEA